MRLIVAQAAEEVVPRGLEARDWLIAGVILAAGIVAAILARALVAGGLRKARVGKLGARLAGRAAGYLVGIGGLLYALVRLDVRIGPLLGALGIGGLALALASQNILANLIAGILLELRRPFRRGDEIASNGYEGVVEDINLRAVLLRTYDGERVFLPSAKVLGEPIENRTAHGTIRSKLTVGVAYGTDLGRAREVILEATRDAEGTNEEPTPTAWVESFGDSSIDLGVYFWHGSKMATTLAARSSVATAIDAALRRVGIEIPFPQRVVRLEGNGSDGGVDPGAS